MARIAGFRLGVYVFKDAEIVDFAAPYGVFSVARRFDAELDAFLIADAMRPVQTQAGFTVLPNYSFADRPAMDAFLIPGGFGTRQEIQNRRLHEFIRSLPEACLLTSVCTGSWVYGRMGLLDGLPATNRKEPDRVEMNPPGMVPIDRLKQIAPACTISRARVVDAGRIITAGGITGSTASSIVAVNGGGEIIASFLRQRTITINGSAGSPGVVTLRRRAQGGDTSVINSIEQIDRGYEALDERLRKLGAKIERAA